MTTNPRDEALLRYLDADPPACILTVTQRLAFTLRARVAELRAGLGRVVAETPPIHSLDEWVEERGRGLLVRAAVAVGASDERGLVLLTSAAETLVWERIIAKAPGDLPGDLLDTGALAATAVDAWRRICLWGEPPWSGPLAEDAEAFRQWIPRLRARLEADGFVTTSQLPGLVADAIRRGELEAERPAELVVLGFEEWDPAATLIVDALRERGTRVTDELVAAPAAACGVRVWSAATPAAELRSVAARVRERLLAEPDARIAVLTPDLSAYGNRLERVFEEELDPAGVVDLAGTSVRRFDYAEAPSLGSYPLVANALDLLSLGGRRVPFETASRILLSEYPRDEDSGRAERVRVGRGVVEARLRRERSAVLHVSGRPGSLATALRAEGLDAAARGYEQLAQRLAAGAGTNRSPSGWRKEWIERLKVVGWPGHIRGDVEGLVFRRWRDALDDFAMLEAVESSMHDHEALSRLRAICAAVRVQPPASSRSVQVMNVLDAAGLEFDVVFAIGMTSTAFPMPPRPNPLLPVAWQRTQHGMPRASVEGERELAESVWSRLRLSTRELVASYPALGEREEENSPSPFLVAQPTEDDAARHARRPWWLVSALAATPLEARPVDAAVPALVRKGGSSILQHQSDCAFRAFASRRLGAERLEAIQPQPDASRRGTLVHAALEKAYGDISSSEDLAGLGEENIAAVARDAAEDAIERNRDFFVDAADLENATRLWLAEMVAAWMSYERAERTGPWQIENVEADQDRLFPPSAAEPLTIRFRPDRVDRIADDALVILDFKTSSTPKTASRWNGERPAELQLPLYLALLEGPASRVDGIAFANLSARDKCDLRGVAASQLAPSFKPPRGDYGETVASWKQALEALALAYLGGEVRVDPREPGVCKQCASHALCRVIESGLAADDDDGDEAE